MWPRAWGRRGGEPIEHVLLFDAPTLAIPFRATRPVDGRDAWSLDAALPDSLALISPRAIGRLGRDPVSRGVLAGLLSCIVLEPCFAEAAEPPATGAAFVVEPQRTEGDPKKQAEGLPDSVFQVALKQRVELSLPSGMTVNGTILAMDASTVTFSTELDGNVIVIQRTGITGVRLLGNAKQPTELHGATISLGRSRRLGVSQLSGPDRRGRALGKERPELEGIPGLQRGARSLEPNERARGD